MHASTFSGGTPPIQTFKGSCKYTVPFFVGWKMRPRVPQGVLKMKRSCLRPLISIEKMSQSLRCAMTCKHVRWRHPTYADLFINM